MAPHVADGRDGDGAVSGERGKRLAELVVALADENAHLQRALDSRVVIEQAKGILAERFGLDVTEAFELLRRSARDNRLRLRDLSERVVASSETPAEILRARA